MKVALVRILGNDLPPRRPTGTVVRNLEYIIENEEEFDNTDKYFVINRVIDPEEREKLIRLAGNDFEIPIDINEYLESKEKANYLTNVNAARNYVINTFIKDYDVVLPLDGNCFFDSRGYQNFYKIAYNHPYHGYFLIPSCRLSEISEISRPNACEMWIFDDRFIFSPSVPQIAFTPEHDLKFIEEFPHGEIEKFEMLNALGVPGVWNTVNSSRESRFFGSVMFCGYVFKLPSGNKMADSNNVIREEARNEGILNMLSVFGKYCG